MLLLDAACPYVEQLERPERTALATIKCADPSAVIQDVCCRADDDAILSVIERADKTGIDCPFGWPDAFVHFVTVHHSGPASLPRCGIGAGWHQELTMRRTDAFVHDKLGIWPLSVSADKIAHVALRCAVLLARLDAAGRPVDRSGTGPVVEVYPRASLRSWDLYRPGYKQSAKSDILSCLVDDLRAKAPWLDCGPHGQTLRRSHDAFDAVIAAMTARAAAQNQTFPPSRDDLAAALAEGWIPIPNSPIGQLLRNP
jgi:predicted nuclease with RNAse H fold